LLFFIPLPDCTVTILYGVSLFGGTLDCGFYRHVLMGHGTHGISQRLFGYFWWAFGGQRDV
jgi:hypothetical protein